jgi:hypothetical protein
VVKENYNATEFNAALDHAFVCRCWSNHAAAATRDRFPLNPSTRETRKIPEVEIPEV